MKRLRSWCAALAMMLTAAAAAAEQSDRVALVIANGAYPGLSKPLAVDDADKVGKALKGVGFTSVEIRKNLTHDELVQAIDAFAARAKTADWAVIYFSGGGLEVEGTDYVMPVDARPSVDLDIAASGIPLDDLARATRGARTLKLLVLDTLHETRLFDRLQKASSTRTFAQVPLSHAESDVYTVFATKVDGTPVVDAGTSSPLAAAFVEELRKPGAEMSLVFRRVRTDLAAATKDTQQLSTFGNLPSAELYFVPPASSRREARPAARPEDVRAAHPPPVARRPTREAVHLKRAPTPKCFVFNGEKAC